MNIIAQRIMLSAPMLLLAACANYTNLIAQEAVAAQASPSWFDGLGVWHVPTTAVPASPAVPADSPARDMVFGTPLNFIIGPVNPASDFQVVLTFLDDGGDRVQALTVGAEVISPSFALPPKAIYSVRWNVSAAAVTTGANLAFSFASISGPNAILSSFALYSSNPADPAIRPVEPPGPSHALPRLTPRPLAVAGTDSTWLDLMGTWQFDPAPPASLLEALGGGGGSSAPIGNWSSIAVPGEYTLQGFRVSPGTPVLYQTTYAVPAAWAALRTKLRCDGVYSNATIYVNGALVGGHLGGFTPFELDVTRQTLPGGASNTLSVVVVGASLADSLASGSQYATHDLGGITRKIGLLAVPPVSVADVHAVTSFADDGTYSDATLQLNVSLANDGDAAAAGPYTVDAVLAYGGVQVASGSVAFPAAALPGGGSVAYAALNLSVTSPALWDPEHPRLHNLTLSLLPPAATAGSAGPPSETVQLRVGFREVRIAGVNRVAVNGRAIKARGTTRHEAHPLAGRSLWGLEPAGGQWARDIATFRDANINYIRTSHYPPAEELMAAADELGMLIELEMPFCWASGNAGSADFNYTVQAQREAVVFNRNHPSVVHWSLGNESPWTANFAGSLARYLRELDATRLFMFDGGSQQPIPPLDLLSVHYPSFDGPGEYANGSQPTLFGEYAHLNCYNRRELAADPGVRDIWGLGVSHMWELIYASPGTLGACYWAGIDDYFFMPTSGEPVGYGEWGVVDAWTDAAGFRRAKPETFLVRNIYSPVRLQPPAPGAAWAPHLVVDNRHDFTDLAEIAFAWSILGSGLAGAGAAAGAPHTAGLILTLQGLPPSLPAGVMQVNASSPRGFLINSWEFPLQAAAAPSEEEAPVAAAPAAAPSVVELPDGRLEISDAAGAFTWFVSPAGAVSGNTSASNGPLLVSGPTLMVLAVNDEGGMQLTEGMPPILPFNDPLPGWALSNRTFGVVGDAVQVVLAGAYADAAKGAFTLTFDGAARLRAAYSFLWTQAAPVSPRQVGLVWGAAGDLAAASWRRTAPWSAYPPDHIGRPAGDDVTAGAGPAPGNTSRPGPWSRDPAPLGCADFRATRHNVTVFQLGAGGRALAFLSANGTQHARAWWDADASAAGGGGVGLLTADLSNEGGNPFSREKVLPQPVVSTGSTLAGQVVLQLGSALP